MNIYDTPEPPIEPKEPKQEICPKCGEAYNSEFENNGDNLSHACDGCLEEEWQEYINGLSPAEKAEIIGITRRQRA